MSRRRIEILEEYAEVIAQKMSAQVASSVIHLLLESSNVELINPYFSLHLIDADQDDNKFVDCAFAANATFIVSNDKHFDVLKVISFPQLIVLKLKEFLGLLQSDSK
jgi:putative PIN family toxin of toxin-antitoxin system